MGYSPWDHRESDMTEPLTLTLMYVLLYKYIVYKHIYINKTS